MRVAGIDGCRGGWLVVVADWEPHPIIRAIEVVPDFAAALALTGDCAAIAVDIPIGLAESDSRTADLQARRLLAPARASSVFPAPFRPVLAATDYTEARRLSIAAGGKSITLQSYNILDKIREVDELMTPQLQQRVRESHPEVSFRALNAGRPVLSRKRSLPGHAEREALLAPLFGLHPRSLRAPPASGRDDLYDACVLTWTGRRLLLGEAVSLPETPEYDRRALRMEIVY